MHFIDLENSHAKPWKLLEAHPAYDAAKNREDRNAALHLVHCFLKSPENQLQMNVLKQKYHDAVIVPVHAMEAGGKNRIPGMLSEYINKLVDIEADHGIIQTNRVHRTGTDEWYRFAFRPAFGGEVKKGCRYILVDDVFSNGGSFNELRLYIERSGGRVVQTAAMSLGGHGDKLAPEPEVLKKLVDKFGKDSLSSFLKEINLYDGNYNALTNPEAFALGRAPSLDEARDRILAARQTGNTRMGGQGHEKNEYKAPKIIPPEQKTRRGLRR
jgi:hypothetical protein